jgi:hypothetical protein
MKYELKTYTLQKLAGAYKEKCLPINREYQRGPTWKKYRARIRLSLIPSSEDTACPFSTCILWTNPSISVTEFEPHDISWMDNSAWKPPSSTCRTLASWLSG